MEPLQIIIDKHEQTPWFWPPDLATMVRGTLNAGDYALVDDDRKFAVERKSLDDLVGTLASGWQRFKNELQRMKDLEMPARIIIVEGNFQDILDHKYNHPRVSPRFVLRRLTTLAFAEVQVIFASNALAASGYCWRLLYHRWKQLHAEKEI